MSFESPVKKTRMSFESPVKKTRMSFELPVKYNTKNHETASDNKPGGETTLEDQAPKRL